MLHSEFERIRAEERRKQQRHDHILDSIVPVLAILFVIAAAVLIVVGA